MPTFRIEFARLRAEVTGISRVTGTGAIPVAAVYPLFALMVRGAFADAIDRGLAGTSLEQIEAGLIGMQINADDGKAAANAAETEFLNRLQVARARRGATDTVVVDVDPMLSSIEYIPISPTKHLKTSSLMLDDGQGTRVHWEAQEDPLRPAARSGGVELDYRCGVSTLVYVVAVP